MTLIENGVIYRNYEDIEDNYGLILTIGQQTSISCDFSHISLIPEDKTEKSSLGNLGLERINLPNLPCKGTDHLNLKTPVENNFGQPKVELDNGSRKKEDKSGYYYFSKIIQKLIKSVSPNTPNEIPLSATEKITTSGVGSTLIALGASLALVVNSLKINRANKRRKLEEKTPSSNELVERLNSLFTNQNEDEYAKFLTKCLAHELQVGLKKYGLCIVMEKGDVVMMPIEEYSNSSSLNEFFIYAEKLFNKYKAFASEKGRKDLAKTMVDVGFSKIDEEYEFLLQYSIKKVISADWENISTTANRLIELISKDPVLLKNGFEYLYEVQQNGPHKLKQKFFDTFCGNLVNGEYGFHSTSKESIRPYNTLLADFIKLLKENLGNDSQYIHNNA